MKYTRPQEGVLSREDVTALFQRRGEAWARHDADGLAATHAERSLADSPLQGRLEGRQRIRDVYQGWYQVVSQSDIHPAESLIDGNRVAEFFVVAGTQSAPFYGMPATARRIELKGAWLFTIGTDGLIADDQRIYDVTGMLVQLGVLKARPSPGDGAPARTYCTVKLLMAASSESCASKTVSSLVMTSRSLIFLAAFASFTSPPPRTAEPWQATSFSEAGAVDVRDVAEVDDDLLVALKHEARDLFLEAAGTVRRHHLARHIHDRHTPDLPFGNLHAASARAILLHSAALGQAKASALAITATAPGLSAPGLRPSLQAISGRSDPRGGRASGEAPGW